MFNKSEDGITGNGPRYCMSLETKINRFADKDSHVITLEPEGLNVHEFYPNGISTSLPDKSTGISLLTHFSFRKRRN